VLIAVLMAAAIALFFWTQSRVPALNTKAQMGQRNVVAGIAFDIVLPVTDDQPAIQRIAHTAVNWSYTNWKGMTFGVLFASAFFVILAYLPRHEFRGQMLNTLKGVVTGIPLGVCVNCTTPIAHGMYKAGVRLETVLATLVSSPTLNVIVLSMSFSLLPFQYALVKVLGVALFVVLVIPLVSRLGKPAFDSATPGKIEAQLGDTLYRTGVIEPVGGQEEACELEPAACDLDVSWWRALQDVCTDFLRALWFVFRTTVPFMLLAGVLGAAVIELVPVNDLTTLPNTLLAALAVAAIGAFLPVPIAFDVVIVSLLIASGVPILFAMTLLFVLGIFSIYPFLILWRNVGAGVALGLFAGAIVVGLACGYGLQSYEQWDRDRVIAAYQESDPGPATVEQPGGTTAAGLIPAPPAIAAAANGPEVNAEKIAIATRICMQHESPYAQKICLADFMQWEFGHGAGEDFCEAWRGAENEPVRGYCHTILVETRLVREAESARDTGPCGLLPSQPKQLQCRQAVVLERIKTGDDISLCRDLGDPRLVYNCLQQGIVIRLDKFNDPQSCRQFGEPREIERCFNNARVLELAEGRRLENCDVLDEPGGREYCKRVVVFGMLDDGADAAVCSDLAGPGQQGECAAHAATIAAARSADPALCAAITQAQALDVCRRVAINQQITREINRAATLRISQALPATVAPGQIGGRGAGTLPGSGGALAPAPFYGDGTVSISRIPYRDRGGAGQGFTRNSGIDFGIADVWKMSPLEFNSPFMMGRGIAAGDFDNDHLPDVVLASNDGLHLFRNTGDGRFAPYPVNFGSRVPRDLFVVALVDVDNDGWQDIVATGYGGNVTVVHNDGEGFGNPIISNIANPDANLAVSAAFGDLDRDGDLDIMLGNWSFGEDKSFLENYSANRLLENTAQGFQPLPLDDVQGDPLSVLFSDLDGDGNLDLAIGNDREVPDAYLLGDGTRTLARIGPQAGRVPATPFNTMSVWSADFNNDLKLDVFSTDMTFSAGPQVDYCDGVDDAEAAERCRMLLAGRERIAHRDLNWCENLSDPQDRSHCLTAIYRDAVISSKQAELCDRIPDALASHRLYCHKMIRPDARQVSFSVADNLPQVQSNILLLAQRPGYFEDATQNYGVGASFWTWNAKAADLDNDGWQDIYIGNGFRFGEGAWEIHSNVFFHNQAGERFTIAQEEFGLSDFINTPSYVYIDFDFDGDLDILATGLLSPTRLFINQESKNRAISFSLRDRRGNRFGIGSKIRIYYRQDGAERHQLRELKAGGGFMSFDAPRAHFGLGDQAEISRLEIDWSNGGKTLIDKPLPAGSHYIVTREE
jgi:uncharacterized membrane protein YraQ (UPF0718 family)